MIVTDHVLSTTHIQTQLSRLILRTVWKNGACDVLRVLIKYGYVVHDRNNVVLRTMSEYNHVRCIKVLIEVGTHADLNRNYNILIGNAKRFTNNHRLKWLSKNDTV
jgi:hypothetical protein